ncbi:hypothetical protein FOI42_RS03665 [Escherichia coli]|nr:hypothetical protein [Escherichia coli]
MDKDIMQYDQENLRLLDRHLAILIDLVMKSDVKIFESRFLEDYKTQLQELYKGKKVLLSTGDYGKIEYVYYEWKKVIYFIKTKIKYQNKTRTYKAYYDSNEIEIIYDQHVNNKK